MSGAVAYHVARPDAAGLLNGNPDTLTDALGLPDLMGNAEVQRAARASVGNGLR